ncbi:SREC2-like protein [Mya arenaria]|uniref:SREC2-like protein n=2 Tax=Mya arenaria TaxID=6604 RepID=A0ABY7F1J5_MYAAR|nr:SREC2-like protein [Mya arenaria]
MVCSKCRGGNCNQEGECTSCFDRKYGSFCNKTCSEDCVGSKCNQLDGSCQHQVQCPLRCVSCTDSITCTECDVYYYGFLCSSICSSTCKGGRCDIESGRCENCESSYYGVFCENRCSLTCASAGCERQTGICFGCNELSVHGLFCNITCSNNCTDLQCSQENGYCSNGCIPNHYGSMCDSICPENCANTTTDSKCDSSGNCLSGCFDGFIGDTCRKVETTDTDYTSNNGQMSGTPATAIGGAVTGLVVLGVVVVLVVVVILKRRKRRKKTYEDMLQKRSSQDTPYSTLALASTTEYEIPDSEPRSGLSMESKDTGVYYNNENVYYKNVGGNVQKK